MRALKHSFPGWSERGSQPIMGYRLANNPMDSLPNYINGFLAILLLTSFVKIATALSIMRIGLGLESAGFGLVIFLLSLCLSILVCNPQIEKSGGLEKLLASGSSQAQLDQSFRPFLEKHVESSFLERIQELNSQIDTDQQANSEVKQEIPLTVLIVSFLLSELKDAFLVGLMILIPFLVIDLLVVNLLMALDITQMSYSLISLPLKLLLVYVLDGWLLISEKLIRVYAG